MRDASGRHGGEESRPDARYPSPSPLPPPCYWKRSLTLYAPIITEATLLSGRPTHFESRSLIARISTRTSIFLLNYRRRRSCPRAEMNDTRGNGSRYLPQHLINREIRRSIVIFSYYSSSSFCSSVHISHLCLHLSPSLPANSRCSKDISLRRTYEAKLIDELQVYSGDHLE